MHEYGKYYLLISERMFYIMRYKGGEREFGLKCIFNFQLARVNSSLIEITSAWIFPSSFYKILLQMIPCLCRRRIK